MSYYFIIRNFISAEQKRANYIQVFYGLNPDYIRNLISNCEKLMDKLKGNKNKIMEKDLEENSEEKNSLIENKKQVKNNQRNIGLINKKENKINTIMTSSTKIFISFYLLFMIIIYCIFPYVMFILYKMCNKAIEYSNFFSRLYSFHSNIIHLFNVYREYIFDNQSIIDDMTPFEYLIKFETISFDNIAGDVKIINNFLNENLIMDDEMINLVNKELCSFYITDYFNSSEQCRMKFGGILNYDFIIFSTNFIQRLRSVKNIVAYRHETELIIGNLTEYNVELWETWAKNYSSEISDKSISFRLGQFNDEILHSEINLMFVNIFIPYIEQNRKKILKSLMIEGYEFHFILIFSTLIVLILLVYFLYFLPKINKLNNFIYKTKNMVTLIPMEVLISQTNIKSLIKLY